jgi:hypothetical protein
MLTDLENWYQRQCNGEWEHEFGVKIETLDNPGWSVRIDLADTRRDGSTLPKVFVERSEHDWMCYWAQDNRFEIALTCPVSSDQRSLENGALGALS